METGDMRIVYVLTSLGMGGAERQVVALAERMARRGHSVVLLVLRAKLPEEWPTAIEVLRLNIRRSPLSVAAGIWRGWRFLRSHRPDLVHSHSFHANMIGRLLGWTLRKTVVISTIHNVYEGGWARMLAYRLSDCLSRRTTAVSTAAAEKFVRLKAVPQSKCVVVTNGIDTAEFSPLAKRREETRTAMGVCHEFVWLSAGRIVLAKDFPNLLRAFAQVSRVVPDAQLWIAGEGDSTGLMTLMGYAQGREGIRWLGLRRDLPALLDAADGFVLASAWEGMPLVIGEAMAMEKPVVATDVGGVGELAGDCAALVAAHDSDALAAAMLATMNLRDEDRRKIGEAARARIASQFSMEARADDWEALYRKVILSQH